MVEHRTGFVSYALMKEYIAAGVLKPYDLSAKLREKHDTKIKRWREARSYSQ